MEHGPVAIVIYRRWAICFPWKGGYSECCLPSSYSLRAAPLSWRVFASFLVGHERIAKHGCEERRTYALTHIHMIRSALQAHETLRSAVSHPVRSNANSAVPCTTCRVAVKAMTLTHLAKCRHLAMPHVWSQLKV